MRHDGRTIVRSRCKERVALVVCYGTDALAVMPQCLIGLGRQVQIEPKEPAVISSDEDVITAWMNGNGRDPLGTSHQFLGQFLFQQVVDSDVTLRL